MVKKQDLVIHTKANLSTKPKSIGKAKIGFDFEIEFSKRAEPKPKDLEFVYKSYPLAFAGINLIADECVARGFEIVDESEEHREETLEWMEKINFKDKIYQVIVNTLLFGNGYFEIVPDEEEETIDLVVLDPAVVDFQRDSSGAVLFNPEGNPKGYVQQTGTGTSESDIKFTPDEIAHYVFYTLRGRRSGISLLSSVMRNITHAMNTDRSVAEAIFRHGFAQFDVTVGDDIRRPTSDDIDAIASDVADLQVTNEYVHSSDIKVQVLEGKNTRSYDKYNQLFVRNIVSGMGIPEPLLLGTGESSNKATADVQSRHFRSMIETIQAKLKTVSEDTILKLFAELKGWTDFPRIEWNEVLPEEESAKVARAASLFEQGIVTRTEVREMLGLPPLSDFGDLKPAPVMPGMPPGQAPQEPPQSSLPEKRGPTPKDEPRSPDRSAIPPMNRTQPSDRGRGSLKDNKELNELKGQFNEALNHYFDSLRSSTLNKIISFNELSDTKSTVIPLDQIAKELTRDHKELGSLIYIFMKESTKLGLRDSGSLQGEEKALLSQGDADYLDTFVDVLAKQQMDDIFNKVNWLILDAFAKHESIGKITNKVNEVFFNFTSFGSNSEKQVKANLISETESNRAYNNGLLIGFANDKVEFVGRECVECESCPKCNIEQFNKLLVSEARGLFPIHPSCTCTFRVF